MSSSSLQVPALALPTGRQESDQAREQTARAREVEVEEEAAVLELAFWKEVASGKEAREAALYQGSCRPRGEEGWTPL